jgi:hypothetical protein
LGLLVGYIAYIPALGIVLFLKYGKVDGEIFFYGLYLPIQVPLLLLGDFRETLQGEGQLLQVLGILMMAPSVFVALRMRKTGRKSEESGNA